MTVPTFTATCTGTWGDWTVTVVGNIEVGGNVGDAVLTAIPWLGDGSVLELLLSPNVAPPNPGSGQPVSKQVWWGQEYFNIGPAPPQQIAIWCGGLLLAVTPMSFSKEAQAKPAGSKAADRRAPHRSQRSRR
jgi:hypothetical protein